jgi:hypothetical protein
MESIGLASIDNAAAGVQSRVGISWVAFSFGVEIKSLSFFVKRRLRFKRIGWLAYIK